MGSMNLFQMVNCSLSFLLIIVKNNKTTGVKNENAERIKLKYPEPISPKRTHGSCAESLNIPGFRTGGGWES